MNSASAQSTFSSFDRIVNQRGSGGLFVLGIIAVVIGIIIGSSLDNIAVSIIPRNLRDNFNNSLFSIHNKTI